MSVWERPSHLRAAPGSVVSSMTASFAHWAVLTSLVELLGVAPLAANAAAALVGALVNFSLNKKVVFVAQHGTWAAQGARYALVSATSLAIVSFLMHMGMTRLGLPYQVAWLLSSAFSMAAFSYPAHRLYIFATSLCEVGPAVFRALRMLGTVGGLGYTPRAPGTAGTLAALPILWLFRGDPLAIALLAAAVSGAAVVVAEPLGRLWGHPDDQRIVLDEVAGMLVSMVFVPITATTLLLGFFAFRAADMLKPWPSSYFDRRKDGLGCIFDDVAAGAWVCGGLHLGLWVLS